MDKRIIKRSLKKALKNYKFDKHEEDYPLDFKKNIFQFQILEVSGNSETDYTLVGESETSVALLRNTYTSDIYGAYGGDSSCSDYVRSFDLSINIGSTYNYLRNNFIF